MSMNTQGRPSAPSETALVSERATFTGNKALAMEEPLLFEIAAWTCGGVDLDEVEDVAPALGSHARKAVPDLPALTEPETMAPLCAPVVQELRHRCGPLSARLLHDEAQSAPREKMARRCRASATCVSVHCSRCRR